MCLALAGVRASAPFPPESGRDSVCYSLHHCDRTPEQHHLRSIYLTHSLKAQSIMAGKTWRQKCEAAGHTMSIVRKQEEMNDGV